MRRRSRASAAALVAVASLGIGAAASCTTFDGVSLPSSDGGGDTTTVDAPSSDAGVEAGPPPPGYLSLADAVRVCSLVFQCPFLASSVLQSVAVPVDSLDYSLCVHWLAGPIPPDRVGFAVQAQTFACMARGTTCQQAASCLAIEYFGPTDPRCADAGPDAGESCQDDGGTVLHCNGDYALHCGAAYYAPGSQCMQGDDGTHWCSLNKSCSTSTQCLGTLLDYCGAGSNLHEAVNCAYDGYTCAIPRNKDSGLPDCITGTLSKPCNAAGTSCAGGVVEVCDGFDDSEFDCAAMGASCSAENGPALCARSDDTCTPFDRDVNQCTGTAISLCVGGHKQTFDCATVGLTCIPGGAASGHCG